MKVEYPTEIKCGTDMIVYIRCEDNPDIIYTTKGVRGIYKYDDGLVILVLEGDKTETFNKVISLESN